MPALVMIKVLPIATVAEAARLARGYYRFARLRCGLAGLLVVLPVALSSLERPVPALAYSAIVGVPFGVAVALPALGFFTLARLRNTYGDAIVYMALFWARTAGVGDRFRFVNIVMQHLGECGRARRTAVYNAIARER
jgi:hypothetical protein